MSLRLAIADSLIHLTAGFRKKKAKPSGVLLVSARGPAEMVFLASVLPRFMRLADTGEKVTFLLRQDALGMSFLFPRSLQLKAFNGKKLAEDLEYRLMVSRQLQDGNYRLAVALDHRRDADIDDFLVLATEAPERVAMEPAPSADARVKANCARYTAIYPTGPLRQDKIIRWSNFANEISQFRHPPALALMPDHRLPDPARLEMPTVVIFPFSGVAERQVQPDTWRLILDLLPKTWHVRVAGHRNDFDRNPQFAGLLKLPRVSIDATGFDVLAPVLLASRMVIGADTAGVHLSILLGVPTLVLASAAYVGAGVPYDERIAPANAHFLYQPMECQGCLGHCHYPLEDKMLPCVAQLDIDLVMQTVRDMIARGGF